MGIFPRRNIATLRWSLSTQVTSLPDSAKPAPATNPTYPVPTTAIFIQPPKDIKGYPLVLFSPCGS